MSAFCPARRARLIAVLGAVVVLGVVPGGAHAAAWGAGPAFGAGATAIGGDLVEAPDDSVTAVWTDGTGPYAAHAQHAGPTDALSAPIALGPAADAPYGVPHAAASPGGTTAVVWLGYDSVADDYPLHLVLLNAAGAKVRDTIVTTLTSDEAQEGFSDVDVDAAGTATVVWAAATTDASVGSLHAVRVTSSGVRSTPVALGTFTFNGDPPMRVATTPGGVSWVAWPDTDGSVDVVRLGSGGAIEAGPAAVSSAARGLNQFAVTASSAGGAVAWEQLVGSDSGGVPIAKLTGTRLPLDGALTATGFETPQYGMLPFPGARDFALAIGPDGAVSAAWVTLERVGPTMTLMVNRFAPGETTATAPQVGDRVAGSGGYPESPALVNAPGGSVVASWLKVGSALAVGVRSLGPDGTLSPTTGTIPVFDTAPAALPELIARQGDDAGGIVAVATGGPTFGAGTDPWAAATFRFDAIPPTLSVDVPATAAPLTPVRFTATVADPATAPVSWDFGDGTSAAGTSVTHVFAAAGTYTVRATATDENGNQAVVKRSITIAAPATVTTPAGSGATPGSGTGPVSVAAVAAGLKVTKATRTATRVTVSGTIAKAATGKVTIVYSQKVGHKTIKVTKTARIAKGSWTITIRLPRKLTRGKAARVRGTVTASWAGTKTIKKATVRRSVSLAKAHKK